MPILAFLGAWAGHIAYHYPAAGRDAYGTARTQPANRHGHATARRSAAGAPG
ncbi:hypothetical protein ACFY0A_28080 [Streptomyces sp. NPDC001698]|uniref:hypothetical protein n=1 Tax=unclassified Streptomyces TaxID=2593676 RepID=UPI00342164DE